MAEKWNDPIEQILKYHRNISEYVTDFEKISEFAHNPESWKSPEFDNFLKKNIYDHFMLEEKKIFPVLVKKAGGGGIKEIVQELYKEHEEIMAKVSKIRGAWEKGEMNRDVFMLVKDVFNQVLEHAAKEDDEIIPVLIKNRELFKENLKY
jgi:iron-sulfur cluster repair protein YtfE (RIC family)